MKNIIFVVVAWLSLVFCQAQDISVTPMPFEEDEEITIMVSNFDPQAAWSVTDLYLWAWYLDDNGEFVANAAATGTDFGNSPETALFTDNGDGTYSYSFVPTDFYGDTGIPQIAFLVKSQDGSNQTADNIVDVGETTPPPPPMPAPTPAEEPVPAGLLDGINLDPNDATKATLVLFAPSKDFVHVIGDFNNWEINDDFLMKKDSSRDRFWIELVGLTPQFDHLYQYLVEFDINVADPYSTLVLDAFGGDDAIDESVFPDLPEYPAGQTQAITVLRTGDPEYEWQTTDFERPKKTDLVIYELLVRDFDERHSFDAVRSRLDYLQELGVNTIELMPVNEFDGNESWGYNPSFHMALDKYYGTKNALKALIDECHARDMAVVLDVVYNHGTGQHPYYRMWNTDNGGFGGQAAPDNPFFNPVTTHAFAFFNDFNHQQQATKDYVNRTVSYWIEEFQIDGMRWDLTKGFTQNCSPDDEPCTNGLQQDRVEVLKGYADNQWAADEDFMVIFEHLGVIEEEEQWANYRADEGKGILLWNKMVDIYNEATMGYHEDGKSDFSNVSYQEKGFELPAAVSYLESHDEQRLMFKNLEFGNSTDGYDVKNLDTALNRMETAGAFFFTVPGPKMFWQFGELGYEVDIDFNGRTGPKPIRWEYADDPNRKAIYDLWSQLIQLKIEEPIFETDDIVLDLSAATGLKKIQLSQEDAEDDEIQYVTVIGNFGLTTQDIVPDFQETGIWYEFLNGNLKYDVADTQRPISLRPGEFRIYGDQPTALFPDENLPDMDNDGVADMDDLCEDTPFGATVDVTGCTVFSLPVDNFGITSSSETCSNSNNGRIAITANEALQYTATLSGDADASQNFSDQTEFADFEAGEYQVCLTVEGQDVYELCYDIRITEPEALSVSAKLDATANQVTLNLKGGTTYTVRLNGNTYTTTAATGVTSTKFSVNLSEAFNSLSVKTDKDCQGTYEENFVVTGAARLYPNPIRNEKLYVEVGKSAVDTATIALFDATGRFISSKEYPKDNGRIEIDVSDLPSGLIFVELTADGRTHPYKIIKQ